MQILTLEQGLKHTFERYGTDRIFVDGRIIKKLPTWNLSEQRYSIAKVDGTGYHEANSLKEVAEYMTK